MPTLRLTPSKLVVAVVLLVSAAALAQDADTAEVQRYVLTEAALTKYSRVSEGLAALDSTCEGLGAESASIAEMVAALGEMPGADAVLRSAGMAPREYVVFSLSLLQNGLAAYMANQPGSTLPPGFSKANIDFVVKHEAELKRLEQLEAERCGDDSEEE